MAQELDEEEKFPWETVKKLAKYGMMGIPIPKEYGGQGADVLTYIMAVEEMAKVCGTTSVVMSAHTSLCATPILENGTEEQKQKYLVPLAKGRKDWCIRLNRARRRYRCFHAADKSCSGRRIIMY